MFNEQSFDEDGDTLSCNILDFSSDVELTDRYRAKKINKKKKFKKKLKLVANGSFDFRSSLLLVKDVFSPFPNGIGLGERWVTVTWGCGRTIAIFGRSSLHVLQLEGGSAPADVRGDGERDDVVGGRSLFDLIISLVLFGVIGVLFLLTLKKLN